MERDRVMRTSFNNNYLTTTARTTSSFHPEPCTQISLPPKPPISSYLHPQPPGRRADDAELSIFDAERYFNEGGSGSKQHNSFAKKGIIIAESYDSSTNPRDSSVSSVEGYSRNWRSRSFRATPTESSEASWNSQSGLLTNLPGSVAVSVKAFPLSEKRRNGSGSFSTSRRFFGRNCPCYGKKSVDVKEKYSETKSPIRVSMDKTSTVTGASFDTAGSTVATKDADEVAKLKISAGIWAKDPLIFLPEKPFPAEIGHRILNSGRPFVESAGFSFPVLAPAPPAPGGADEPPRESLEVFRPNEDVVNLRMSAEFQRRPPPAASVDDDAASDTSSDLFEIESFSTHSAYRRRDSLDEYPKLVGNAATAAGILQFRRGLEEMAASIAPSECYAPSEVSVEWSVTTAEGGFDRASLMNFSSAASDCGDVRFIKSEFGPTAGNGSNKKKGGLLSCRCENSVNVGPNPVRIGPEQQRPGNMAFAVEPDRGVGMSRFGQEKSELVRRHSAQINRPIQTR